MSNSKNFGWKLSKYIFNKNFNFNRQNIINVCGEKNIVDAYKKISGWKDYNATPLIELKKLSDNLKLGLGIQVGHILGSTTSICCSSLHSLS